MANYRKCLYYQHIVETSNPKYTPTTTIKKNIVTHPTVSTQTIAHKIPFFSYATVVSNSNTNVKRNLISSLSVDKFLNLLKELLVTLTFTSNLQEIMKKTISAFITIISNDDVGQ